MAITLWGVDPSITETEWAILHQIYGRGNYDEVVSDVTVGQLAPTAGGGTRQSVIAAGDAVAAGVLARNSAQVTLTHDANATGINRIDYSVLNINWGGTQATGGTIVVVKGSTTSAVAPALTKNPGVLWQIPLAKVTLAPGAGVLAGSAVEDVRPRSRVPNVYRVTPTSGQSFAGAGSGGTIAALSIADPGWPYRLHIMGSQAFQPLDSNPTGRGNIQAQINGVTLCEGHGDYGSLGASILRPEYSDVRTGSATVTFRAYPVAISGEQLITSTAVSNGFTVAVIPA